MTSTEWEPKWAVAPHRDQVIGDLVAQVAVAIDTLTEHRSDLSRGEDWCNVDAALSGLHRAMIALQNLDHRWTGP